MTDTVSCKNFFVFGVNVILTNTTQKDKQHYLSDSDKDQDEMVCPIVSCGRKEENCNKGERHIDGEADSCWFL